MRFLLLVSFAIFTAPDAARFRETQLATANPIRKVVTLLQKIQEKVVSEGSKEEADVKKFLCYCKTGTGKLEDSIEAAETKIPQLEASIKSAQENGGQLKEEIKAHKEARAAAKASIKEATALREKAHAAFAKESSDAKTNIDAIAKAVAALENGAASSFLQTGGADVLKRWALEQEDLSDFDRSAVLSFLSSTQGVGYAPQSGEIIGILKQMQESMSAGLAAAAASEKDDFKNFEELIAAKAKEIDAATAAIEDKTSRSGEGGVQLVNLKNDLEETEDALAKDKEYLADLEKGCKTKAAEWEERKKTRAQELVAISETIKILNDDDALELFKKTLPSSSSFLQVVEDAKSTRSRALTALGSGRGRSPQLDFIALALRGKSAGFDKVVDMIDHLVAVLKKEQVDDDDKKIVLRGGI